MDMSREMTAFLSLIQKRLPGFSLQTSGSGLRKEEPSSVSWGRCRGRTTHVLGSKCISVFMADEVPYIVPCESPCAPHSTNASLLGSYT